MNHETVEQLLALNRRFYAAFARPFADSRTLSDPALTSILPHIPQRARVLDVGCGNGRLACLLDQQRPGAAYVGIDGVPELVALARQATSQLDAISTTFHVVDVTQPEWSVAAGGPFDCVVILAVLHHIPSFDLRQQVVRESARRLAPGGRVLLSTWQFLDSERQRRKIVEWAEVGISEAQLEPGDYLLDWQREGRGLRYCHLVDGDEVARLAAGSGLAVRESFRAGGKEGNLSLFAVLA